jgi:hypothetical protein
MLKKVKNIVFVGLLSCFAADGECAMHPTALEESQQPVLELAFALKYSEGIFTLDRETGVLGSVTPGDMREFSDPDLALSFCGYSAEQTKLSLRLVKADCILMLGPDDKGLMIDLTFILSQSCEIESDNAQTLMVRALNQGEFAPGELAALPWNHICVRRSGRYARAHFLSLDTAGLDSFDAFVSLPPEAGRQLRENLLRTCGW